MGAEHCEPGEYLRVVKLPDLSASAPSPSATASLQQYTGGVSAALDPSRWRGWEEIVSAGHCVSGAVMTVAS